MVIPFAMFSQEQDDDNFHFIEAGIGGTHGLSTHGALNVAITNSLSSVFANFIDYNLAFSKSDVLFHEISIKLGPYYRFNKYCYIAVSSGISFIWNSKPEAIDPYFNDFSSSTYMYQEEDFLLSIPIQGKVNIAVYKGCCIGLKGTYNKMFDTNAKDKTMVQLFLAVGF